MPTSISLFCQDWGGLIGLRMVANDEARFDRIVAANTILPMSGGKANKAFMAWREFSQRVPVFESGQILQKATATELSTEVVAAYDASYPAGARKSPLLVPFSDTDDDHALPDCDKAWAELQKWNKPFLTLFGDSDPIMLGFEKLFQARVPGTKGQPHQIIENAGHFLQEDAGEKLAQLMADFIKTT